ncbi:MAG TPA: hypothetical protein VKG91_18575 [Roseiarcus sp.]|nr:hypothetical protein [Roseiarcus sp.]
MAIHVFPVIRGEDYDSFRRIIDADFPNTFDEWLNQQSQLAAQKLGSGFTIRHIEVHPDEFTDFLRKSGRRASRHALDNFALQKSGL